MKNRILSVLVVCLAVMGVTACGNTEHSSKDKADNTVETEVSSDKEAEKETPEEKPEEILYVCYSEDVMTFKTEEVTVTKITPEGILVQLCQRKVMDENVEVLDFSEKEIDGKREIQLDLSSNFADYMQTMGSAGEYYVLGGLCNSFLQTYECEQIKLTVEGEALSTGHNDYSEYFTEFE